MSEYSKKRYQKEPLPLWKSIGIGVILGCIALGLLLTSLFHSSKKEEPEEDSFLSADIQDSPQELPEETKEFEGVTVQLKNYTTYELEGLDFAFVLMDLHVTSKEPIHITLDHFETSEKIRLDQVDYYVNRLEEKGYFLGKQNVWFSIVSEENECDVRLFVPVRSKSTKQIQVNYDFGKDPLVLSLEKAEGSGEMFMYQAEDVISDGKTYQMVVSEAYDITGEPLYQGAVQQENEYILPSTTKVYIFRVKAVSLYGDTIVIEDAQYVPESGEQFVALDASIRSEKMENILGKEIQESQTGTLFFYAYNPDDHQVKYNGVLRLKMRGSTNEVSIVVDLN